MAHEKAAQERLSRRASSELSHGYLVGSWREGEKIYYDPSEVIMDRDEALKRAKERNQLAIYDFAKKETVYVDAKDHSP